MVNLLYQLTPVDEPYTPKVLKDMLDLTHKKEEDRLAVCSDEGGGSGLSKYLWTGTVSGPPDVVFKAIIEIQL